MLAARDSGQDALQPFTLGGLTALSLGSPMYSGGATPPTVKGREAAFVGWVGMTIVPGVILATAIGGYAHTEVALRFSTGAGAVVFTSGRGPAGEQATTVNLHNGWTVETLATPTSTSLKQPNSSSWSLWKTKLAKNRPAVSKAAVA